MITSNDEPFTQAKGTAPSASLSSLVATSALSRQLESRVRLYCKMIICKQRILLQRVCPAKVEDTTVRMHGDT